MSIFHHTHALVSGFTATMILLLMTARPLHAQAAPCYSQCDGDFSDSKTWNTARDGTGSSCTPGDAVIQPGHTVYLDSTDNVANVTVEDVAQGSPGVLEVRACGILVVTGGIDVEDDLAVAGILQLKEDTGDAPIIRAGSQSTVTLDGSFTVTGLSGCTFDNLEGGSFHLLSGSTLATSGGPLTISAPIENDGSITTGGNNLVTISGTVKSGSTGTFTAASGHMTVSGNLEDPTATFSATGSTSTMTFSGNVDMDGIIEANGGDVTFNSLCLINNDSIGTFRVTNANSTMRFDHSDTTAPSLTGDADFQVTAGTMRWSSDLTTAGGYQQTGGTIRADAGVTFTANGAY